jgi:hypothetical protein
MGLQKSYGIDNSQYFNSLMIFCMLLSLAIGFAMLMPFPDVGYMVGEFPFAMLLRKFPPTYIYGSTVILFGMFATLCVATKSCTALLILRLFAESSCQTSFLYLSLWYKPEELAMRSGMSYLDLSHSLTINKIKRSFWIYSTGRHSVLLGFESLGLLAAIANLIIIRKRNAERDARAADFESQGEVDPDMAKSYEELCDYHPGYRHVLLRHVIKLMHVSLH